MIQTKELCKVFKRAIGNENEKGKKIKKKKTSEDFYAVDHVSITANSGEILGILGPNGAGKTTLLRMMGRLMEPTSGEIIIKNGDTEVSSVVEMKRMIGYLSGNTKLYHRFSTREMLEIISGVHGMDKATTEARIEEICRVLSMESFIDNKIERLSTGQTQRANIARCLIHSPSIYIFDEPTLGLDILSSESIIEFMKEEKTKGKTILYSTHYMEEAQYLCDKIVLVHKGRVIDAGTPKELMEKTGTDNLRETFRSYINIGEGDTNE